MERVQQQPAPVGNSPFSLISTTTSTGNFIVPLHTKKFQRINLELPFPFNLFIE